MKTAEHTPKSTLETIQLLRRRGFEDHAISLLLQSAQAPLPNTDRFLRWSAPAVQAAMGEPV